MPDLTADHSLPLRGKRLLVVEDEFLILLDLQNILEAAGAESIVTASHIADAFVALDRSATFDAAVLDLKLDKDSAAPVAERLSLIGVPFVFLTGAPTDAQLALQFGFAPVVGKPFDSATLLEALSQAMTTRR
jgi:CheY-like chemotaxis protein